MKLEEKLKNNIETTLTKEKNELENAFKVKLQNALENERNDLEDSIEKKYKLERRKIEKDFEKAFEEKILNEKKHIEKVIREKYDQEFRETKADLEGTFKEKFAKMEQTEAESSLRAERCRLEEEKASLKTKLETDLSRTVERRLEVLKISVKNWMYVLYLEKSVFSQYE